MSEQGTVDAKAMIAEGLEYHNMNNKKAPTPMWEPVLIGNIVREIDDKCQELSIHAVLDALLEVCKSNEPVKTMEDELEIGSKAIADLIAHMERMGVSSVEYGNFKAVLTPEEMEDEENE